MRAVCLYGSPMHKTPTFARLLESAPVRRLSEATNAAAGAVVLEKGDPTRVWVRRSQANPGYPETWAFAKGRIEDGLDAIATAKKEVEEELGIITSVGEKIGTYSTTYTVTTYFWGERISGPVDAKWKANGETAEVRLVTWKEAIELFKSKGNSRDPKVVMDMLPKLAKLIGVSEEDILAGKTDGAKGGAKPRAEVSQDDKDIVAGIAAVNGKVVPLVQKARSYKPSSPEAGTAVEKLLSDLKAYVQSSTAVTKELSK